MEMIPINFSDKIGRYGELLIIKELIFRGWEVTDHNLDNKYSEYDITLKKDNKKYLADVKTKQRYKAFNYTGVDEDQYNKYINLWNKHKIQFIIFFVDYHPEVKKILYLKLREPDHYKSNNKNNNGMATCCWDLNKMKELRNLKDEEFIHLQDLYNKSKQFKELI
jgi:Holliday junction resolvase-like predicted endonuclease